MKYWQLVLCIAIIGIIGCTNNETKRENLQNAITEFSQSQGTIEFATYYPEKYTEVQTDSIISNTFKVSIKNYTKMDTDIILDSREDNYKIRTHYHRVFASDISVSHKSKPIFETTLTSEDFENSTDYLFWQTATLEHAWVNQEASNSEALNPNISIVNPKLKTYKLYELVLNTEGQHRIRLLETQS